MNTSLSTSAQEHATQRPSLRLFVLVALAVIAWLVAYNMIEPLAQFVTYDLIHLERGSHLGTALAFMMSVVGLSLPEMIILRRVLKPQLIAVFIGVIAIAIILIGFLFNAILQGAKKPRRSRKTCEVCI